MADPNPAVELFPKDPKDAVGVGVEANAAKPDGAADEMPPKVALPGPIEEAPNTL